jgi:hypothetical protein
MCYCVIFTVRCIGSRHNNTSRWWAGPSAPPSRSILFNPLFLEPFMLIKPVVVFAAAVVLAGPVLAEGGTPDHPQPFTSTVSRAEVRAEAIAAARAGLLSQGEATVVAETFVATKTRAQVLAEMHEARRLGLIAPGEADWPVATPAQAEQIRLAGLRAVQQTLAHVGR